MGESSEAICKPKLRGLLHAQIKRNIFTALLLATGVGVALKFGLCEPRKRRYAEFYRTYDAEADFQRMKAAGVFQGVGKDD